MEPSARRHFGCAPPAVCSSRVRAGAACTAASRDGVSANQLLLLVTRIVPPLEPFKFRQSIGRRLVAGSRAMACAFSGFDTSCA